MAYISDFPSFSALHESLSAVVYHYTGVINIVKILQDDHMKAASAIANSSDGGKANRNQHFYISFQRGKYSQEGYAKKGSLGSCIEFDGTKLNANYRSTPIEYYRQPRNLKGAPPKYDPKDVPTKDELEDRITLNVPFLENVRRYVRAVHVLAWNDHVTQHHHQLAKVCKHLAIPLYLYAEQNDYNFKRTDRAVPLDSFERREEHTPSHDEWEERMNTQELAVHKLRDIIPLFVYQDPANRAKVEAIFDPKYHNDTHEGLYWREHVLDTRLRYREDYKGLEQDYFHTVSRIRQSQNPWVLQFAKLLAKELRRYGALYASDYVRLKLAKLDQQREQDALKPPTCTLIVQEGGWSGWEDVTEDLISYNYYDEDLQEQLTKFLQGRGSAEVAQLLTEFETAKMGDLLRLLQKYVKPRGVEKWFARMEMKPVTVDELKQMQGEYRTNNNR